jgi:hypothetical protein
MKFINQLLLKYYRWHEKRRIKKEEAWKNFFLNEYGINCDIDKDKLTHQDILEIFWKILKGMEGYDVSNFDSNTSTKAPAKQSWVWNDLGEDDFIRYLEKFFEFFNIKITSAEYDQVKTFGELADLILKKSKEHKLGQQ